MNAGGREGFREAARALLGALPELSAGERDAAFEELTRICGVDLGRDEKAWSEWVEKQPGDRAPAVEPDAAPAGRLPPSDDLLTDLLRIIAEGDSGPAFAAEAAASVEQARDDEAARTARPGAAKRRFLPAVAGLPELDGYEILSEIGEGGMGTVYGARQLSLGRAVAVKVLRENLAHDEAFVARFMREARLAAALAHPNIVRAIDTGVSRGRYYFAMELVEGETVRAILEREGALPEGRAAQIALEIAGALEYARTRGLIHRDVKPDNILIDGEGSAMLADMGLARATPAAASGSAAGATRITQAATMVGTPDYVSPEQARCLEDIDTRTDVYSLGATLFHMVTGGPPFAGESRADVVSKHLSEPPPSARDVNPRVGEGTALVIRKAMEKARADRYGTPGEMASDLEDVLRREAPRVASAQYSIERGASRGRAHSLARIARSRWGLSAALGAAALVLTLGVYLARGTAEGPSHPEETPELELLRREARRGLAVAGGRDAERRGDRASAVRAYELALEIREDAALRERLVGLRRREAVDALVRKGGGRFAERRWREALDAYRGALEIALPEERAPIQRKIVAAERALRCVQAMEGARLAVAARDWPEAIAKGEAALAAEPGDADAEALLASARRGLEEEREQEIEKERAERRRRAAYDRAMADARAAFKGRAWREAVAHAESALSVVHGDAAAEEIVASAREGLRREKEERREEERRERERREQERKEKAYAAVMSEAERASREGDWKGVRDLALSAASLKPADDRTRRLARLAEEELSREKQITNSIGMKLLLVPAGEFTMGSEEGPPDERPVRRVHLDSYYVGEHEVTNAQFGRYRPGHCGRWREYSPADDMPVVCVSWADAVAFCRWLSDLEGLEYRLPTEAEWEKAARGPVGTTPSPGRRAAAERTYPWGDEPPDAGGVYRANYAPAEDCPSWADDGHYLVAPVGSFAEFASPCGALDMAGNVWEWCLDRYAPGYSTGTTSAAKTPRTATARGKVVLGEPGGSPSRGPRGPSSGEKRVLRGGSFTTGADRLRSAGRAAHVPGFYDVGVGFRCVMVPRRGPSRE